MEFLTPEQVKIEAEKGEIPALECSLKHHRQGETADYEDLIKAVIDEDFGIHCGLCACCELFGFKDNSRDSCKKCPLYENNRCCKGLWDELEGIFSDFEDNYSETNFNKLQTVEGKLCTYIEGVLERKRAEQKEKEDINCANCVHGGSEIPCMKCEGRNNWLAKPKESKPALRHLDYGYHPGHCGSNWIKIKDKVCWFDKDNYFSESMHDDKWFIDARIGNLDDDLALRAEDCKEFKIPSSIKGNSLRFFLDNQTSISFDFLGSSTNNSRTFGLDQSTEIAHKILQMVAFAKRKQKSK